MTNTKTRFIPTFLVLAVLGVAAYAFLPDITDIGTEDDQRTVVVTVDFDPATRLNAPIRENSRLLDVVTMHLDVGAQMNPPEKLVQSPVIRVLHPGKTERVVVYAEQFAGNTLNCKITEKGREPVESHGKGPCEVKCILGGLRAKRQ